MDTFDPSRRTALKASAAAVAAGTMASLGALQARQRGTGPRDTGTGGNGATPVAGPYGPLAPVADLATGLPLLQLPRGFSYTSFGWTGDALDDGKPCPGRHDGMAVMHRNPRVGTGRGNELVLVRNHEVGAGVPIAAAGMYDTGDIGNGARSGGGTTTLRVTRDGRLTSMQASLGGTLVNCAGGLTPWGTWLTCEEIKTNAVSSTGLRHGYVFEVDPRPGRTTARPIVGMGRFSHEAVAVDPRTGIVYLTEDDRNKSGFYRFIPNDRGGRPGSLENGGRLQAARVRGQANADLIVATAGQSFQLEWVDIANPDLDASTVPAGYPDTGATDTLSGPFAQAWAQGALRMSRGEGIWYSAGKMFIVDTSTGVDSTGRRGRGEGAVWVLDLGTQVLSALFVSTNQLAANNPDNVTVSPRGGVVLCEDGGNSPDQYGTGSRLLGLTREGDTFYIAKNNVVLEAADIARAGKNVAAGDYRGSEFCGACWDPHGHTLFVNLQSPGITAAITGPWERGRL